MPNVESVRIVRVGDAGHLIWVNTYLYHPFCWAGQAWGDPELVEVDGAIRCAACRGRMDRNE
jgi:hypothetical protein